MSIKTVLQEMLHQSKRLQTLVDNGSTLEASETTEIDNCLESIATTLDYIEDGRPE